MSFAEAIRLYEVAAALFEKNKFEDAVGLLKQSAELGYVEAQYNLGVCYEDGIGVSQDHSKAVEWYTKAANQGDVKAQTNLGSAYNDGLGVPQDYGKAVEWYTKAANQGVDKAQFNLGLAYANGWGVSKNEATAVEWYTKAADQGNASAQYNLGCHYSNGQGVARDYYKAAEWYTKAASQGHESARHNLELLKPKLKKGCYIATCVYGSYNAPEVWILRRYRDDKLSASWFGRLFIISYYAVSPKIVRLFGKQTWFTKLCKPILNKIVNRLQISYN